MYIQLPAEDHKPGLCGRLNVSLYGTRDAAQLDAKTNEEHTNGANSSADESVDGTQRDAEEHTLQTNGKKLNKEHTAHTDTPRCTRSSRCLLAATKSETQGRRRWRLR